MTKEEDDRIREMTREEKETLRQELVEKQKRHGHDLLEFIPGEPYLSHAAQEAITDDEMLRFLIRLLDYPS